jgi:hypothetical protein
MSGTGTSTSGPCSPAVEPPARPGAPSVDDRVARSGAVFPGPRWGFVLRSWPGRALPGGFRVSARRPAGVGLHVPGDVVQHRHAPGAAPDRGPGPGRTSVHRRGRRHRRRWPDREPVRDPGTGASLTGYRKDLLSTSVTDPVDRPAVPHTSAPPWRVRALHRGSRRWVEARTVVRHGRSAAGRAPSEVSQVAAEVGLQAVDVLGDRGVGHGHPGKGATGLGVLEGGAEDGVQRLAAVVAQQHSVRRWGAPISGATPRSLREGTPEGARGPGSSRRWGRTPGRAGQRVTACPDQSGRRRRRPGG